MLLAATFLPTTAPAQTPAGPGEALRLHEKALARFEAAPRDPGAAAAFGRASFDWAEFSTNSTQRAALAQKAIDAMRRLTALQPTNAAGHHYLAMNLGQLARTKTLGALRIVGEMEREFLAAHRLDPTFDHAGPGRYLGKLYRDAPSWPASIGSRSKSQRHFESSIKHAPDFPENHLCLIETLLKWGESKPAAAAARQFESTLAAARVRWAGLEWAHDWKDWETRWQEIRNRLGASPPP